MKINILDIEKMKKMYKEGATVQAIANEIGIDYTTVSKHLKTMFENGELVKRGSGRRAVAQVKDEKALGKKKKPAVEDMETGGVNCTRSVANKCLYGAMHNKDFKCNYCEITGHCRTVVDRKTGNNSPKHCHCFTQATQKEKTALCKQLRTRTIMAIRKGAGNGKSMSELQEGNDVQ